MEGRKCVEWPDLIEPRSFEKLSEVLKDGLRLKRQINCIDKFTECKAANKSKSIIKIMIDPYDVNPEHDKELVLFNTSAALINPYSLFTSGYSIKSINATPCELNGKKNIKPAGEIKVKIKTMKHVRKKHAKISGTDKIKLKFKKDYKNEIKRETNETHEVMKELAFKS